MKTYYMMANSRKDRGGQCACANIVKLELQAADDSLDFLLDIGFSDRENPSGGCNMCGKGYAERRLTISKVEDLRSV